MVNLVVKFGGRLPAWMPPENDGARTLLAALPSSSAAGSLMVCFWLIAAHTMPLASLIMKFGGRLPAGMLQDNNGATTLSVSLLFNFGVGINAGILLVDGGARRL